MKPLLVLVKKIWKLVLLFLLITITFSYAMFQGGFVSWFLLFSFLPFALYALMLTLYPLKDIKVTRSLSKAEFFAGESVTVNVELTRQKRIPLFYMLVADSLPSSAKYFDKGKQSKICLFPPLGKRFSYSYQLTELTRGEHIFEGFCVKIGDPLGFIEKEIHIDAVDKIIVYPAFEELVYRPSQNQFDQGMAVTKERVQRDTTMATGVRDYQPGDRFSWINWKASAKRNDIMVKEFEQRQSHDVQVIIDCSSQERFEIIVSFAASIIRAILLRGAQVGLLSSREQRDMFPIRGGENQLQQILYGLARMKDDSLFPLELILEKERFHNPNPVTFMLITSLLTKSLVEKAGFMARRKGSVILFLIKMDKEAATEQERILTMMAITRGIRVVMIHERNFAKSFSEVNKR